MLEIVKISYMMLDFGLFEVENENLRKNQNRRGSKFISLFNQLHQKPEEKEKRSEI